MQHDVKHDRGSDLGFQREQSQERHRSSATQRTEGRRGEREQEAARRDLEQATTHEIRFPGGRKPRASQADPNSRFRVAAASELQSTRYPSSSSVANATPLIAHHLGARNNSGCLTVDCLVEVTGVFKETERRPVSSPSAATSAWSCRRPWVPIAWMLEPRRRSTGPRRSSRRSAVGTKKVAGRRRSSSHPLQWSIARGSSPRMDVDRDHQVGRRLPRASLGSHPDPTLPRRD